MITLAEILMGRITYDKLSAQQQSNINTLLQRINIIRKAYNKSMKVSSGFRSMEDHLRIYKEKGITDPNKIPMKSNHLSAAAIDIADPKQELQKWILANIKILEDAQLWCEDFTATKTWVHFQILAPKSGKRFFMP